VTECTVEKDGKHVRQQHQPDAQFFLLIYFNNIILDMFRTNNRSSSAVLYKQLTAFDHAENIVELYELSRYRLS
jgi:hypothetical protein